MAQLKWQTAYAGDEPILRYEVLRDEKKVGQVEHKPQLTREPFVFEESLADKDVHSYRIVTVDATGKTAQTEDILLPGI